MQLVFATHNQNKFTEVRAMLPGHIALLSLNDIGYFEDIHETGKTLVENAQIKADLITQKFGFNCFADDTGLLIQALDGAPGVYSARYAGPKKDDEANMQRVLSELKGTKNRSAQFKTVFAMNLIGKSYLFEGHVKGEITNEKRGNQGFGYDPIFRPIGFDQTFAELPIEIKNRISHRGKATKLLIDFLRDFKPQSAK